MIFELIRRDPALKIAPLTALAAIVCWFLPWQLTVGTFGMALVFALLRAAPAVRASLYYAALPIDTRDLFLARMWALAAMLWLPVGVAALLSIPQGPSGDGRLAGLAASAGAASIIAAAALGRRVKQAGVHTPLWLIPLIGLAFLVFAVRPALLLGGFGAVSAACLAAAWQRLPASFQIAPVEPAVSRGRPQARERTAFAWTPVLRSLFPLRSLAFLPLAVMDAGNASGILILPIFAATCTGIGQPQNTWIFALPVHRRKLLAVCLAAGISPFLAVYPLGRLFVNLQPYRAPVLMGYAEYPHGGAERKSTSTANVEVSREYWARAAGPGQPSIEAPWGETAAPPVHAIFGIHIYNPYYAGPTNTKQFFDWQFERATQAVYGRAIPAPQYSAALQAGLRARPQGPPEWLTYCIGFILVTIAIAICVALFWWKGWSGRKPFWRPAVMWGTFAMWMVPFFGVTGMAAISDNFDPEALLFALLRAVPQNPWILAALSALAAALLFLALERVCSIAEWPVKPLGTKPALTQLDLN